MGLNILIPDILRKALNLCINVSWIATILIIPQVFLFAHYHFLSKNGKLVYSADKILKGYNLLLICDFFHHCIKLLYLFSLYSDSVLVDKISMVFSYLIFLGICTLFAKPVSNSDLENEKINYFYKIFLKSRFSRLLIIISILFIQFTTAKFTIQYGCHWIAVFVYFIIDIQFLFSSLKIIIKKHFPSKESIRTLHFQRNSSMQKVITELSQNLDKIKSLDFNRE